MGCRLPGPTGAAVVTCNTAAAVATNVPTVAVPGFGSAGVRVLRLRHLLEDRLEQRRQLDLQGVAGRLGHGIDRGHDGHAEVLVELVRVIVKCGSKPGRAVVVDHRAGRGLDRPVAELVDEGGEHQRTARSLRMIGRRLPCSVAPLPRLIS